MKNVARPDKLLATRSQESPNVDTGLRAVIHNVDRGHTGQKQARRR